MNGNSCLQTCVRHFFKCAFIRKVNIPIKEQDLYTVEFALDN